MTSTPVPIAETVAQGLRAGTGAEIVGHSRGRARPLTHERTPILPLTARPHHIRRVA